MKTPIIFVCTVCGKPAEFASGGMKCALHTIHPNMIPKPEGDDNADD